MPVPAGPEFIAVADLAYFATIDANKASEMVDDANALAVLAAPCLATPEDLTTTQINAVKAILRGAILRWNDSGSGALKSEQIGDYAHTFDTRQNRRGMFWPSEIQMLQSICSGSAGSGVAYSINIDPAATTVTHSDECSINFGATYCSCGAVLTAGLGYYP